MIRSVVWLLRAPNGYSNEVWVMEEIFENGARMWGEMPLTWCSWTTVSMTNGY